MNVTPFDLLRSSSRLRYEGSIAEEVSEFVASLAAASTTMRSVKRIACETI